MRQPSNMNHDFSRVPQANIQRSTFSRTHSYKTTFNSGYLIPFLVDEVLPGDTFKVNATMFARLATPFVPVMDNLFLDTFYFFVPNRLVWTHWDNFMGEEEAPGDYVNSVVTYLTPVVTTPAGGWTANSLADYFGLPTGITGTQSPVAFPFRAYNLIWNEWFRDENLQTKVVNNTGDGPDLATNYSLLRRNKRHDYFTSALPWPQKGPGVTVPLGGTANVVSYSETQHAVANRPIFWASGVGATTIGTTATTLNAPVGINIAVGGTAEPLNWQATTLGSATNTTGLRADLSTATGATINSLRQAFQIQRLYERDARGGSRYTEIIRSHFGVISPDMRLQRPEYLGGGTARVNISPVAQTSGTSITGQSTPQANLAAIGTLASSNMGFTKSFTEHGTIIGLLEVRADLNYQQGQNRAWNRRTRFDYYWPVLANLGEQSILNQEIYAQGTAGGSADTATFGYQERWAEYRYFPSLITGQFRSTYATPLDVWHLAQKFTSLPTLNSTFIQDNPPVNRIIAVPTYPEFLLDCFIEELATRPMPTYSVPGMIDHF